MVKISPFVVFESVADREFRVQTTATDTALVSLEMVALSNRCRDPCVQDGIHYYKDYNDLQIFFTYDKYANHYLDILL